MTLNTNFNNKKMEQNKNINNKEEQPVNDDCEILQSYYSHFDFKFKIIVIGDSGVGKTSLTCRASSGEYQENMPPTVGIEYFPFVLKYKEKILKLEIWDTCGQEAYRSIVKGFFFNTSLAVIAYAIDDKKSFNSIEEWIRQCKQNSNPEILFFLVGNKNDIAPEK